jgi:hypothetical protein
MRCGTIRFALPWPDRARCRARDFASLPGPSVEANPFQPSHMIQACDVPMHIPSGPMARCVRECRP